MKNKGVRLAVIAAAILVGVSIAKDLIVKTAMGFGLSSALHTSVNIGYSRLTLFPRSTLKILGLRVQNPSGFKGGAMLDIPMIYVDLDASTLFKKPVHVKEVNLILKEIHIIRNEKGQLNVNALNQKQASEESKKPAGASVPFRIDKLTLSIGRVVYKDYSTNSSKPRETVIEIGIKDRTFNNITDPKQIIGLIMVEALTRSTLSGLSDLNVSAFKDQANQLMRQGLGAVNTGTDELQKKAKDVLSFFK